MESKGPPKGFKSMGMHVGLPKGGQSPSIFTKVDPAVTEQRQYCSNHCSPDPPLVDTLIKKTEEQLGMLSKMAAFRSVRRLLVSNIRRCGYKKILEVGMFTGVTALAMAYALPEDGKVVCLEVNEKFADIGKSVWKEEAALNAKIDVRLGPAMDTLDKLIEGGELETFDMVFIDCDNVNYHSYYEKALRLTRKGGAIFIDNVLNFGNSLRPAPAGEDPLGVAAVQALNEWTRADSRVHTTMMTTGDGLTICDKL